MYALKLILLLKKGGKVCNRSACTVEVVYFVELVICVGKLQTLIKNYCDFFLFFMVIKTFEESY